jgi:hypothetical protein
MIRIFTRRIILDDLNLPRIFRATKVGNRLGMFWVKWTRVGQAAAIWTKITLPAGLLKLHFHRNDFEKLPFGMFSHILVRDNPVGIDRIFFHLKEWLGKVAPFVLIALSLS